MDRLAAIEIFIRVVDTGSFSAAARHYDVGQPAVSKAIAQLEDWLGVKLLLRSTRALTPTEAGNRASISAQNARSRRAMRRCWLRAGTPPVCRASFESQRGIFCAAAYRAAFAGISGATREPRTGTHSGRSYAVLCRRLAFGRLSGHILLRPHPRCHVRSIHRLRRIAQ
jgi:hypothetical protein